MAQKKRERKRKPKPENLIVVTVTNTQDGRALDVGVSGNLKLAEAPTLLKIAAKVAEEKMGVPQ